MSSAEALAGPLPSSTYEALAGIDQAVLDALPSAFCICSADGIIVRYNRLAAEFWGRSARPEDSEERFGGSFRLYHFDGQLTNAATPMEWALRTGEPQRDQEMRIVRPDGSQIFALANIEVLKDGAGRLKGAVGVFHDISERKRREDEAEVRRADLEDFFENAVAAMHWVGPDGMILKANQAELDLLGYAREEYVGRNIADFHVDLPVINDILTYLRRGMPLTNITARLRAKDGSIKHVRISSRARIQEGEFINTRCVTFDVTQAVHAEESLATRMAEQSALFDFTDALYRAETHADVYKSAVDAILRALRCDRASVLLLDDAGVMRFVAWRGLSDSYREAVEGHSPWSAGAKDPQPISIVNVAEADLPEGLRRIVLSEGIRALSFVPVMAGGKLAGKFMTYYDAPHIFTAAELDLAVTVARQLGFSLERQRVEDARRRGEQELRDSQERLQLALEAGKMGAWQWDLGSGGVIWSPGLEQIHGLEPGTFGGTFDDFKRDIHPEDLGMVLGELQGTLSSRRNYHVVYRMLHPDGSIRWLEAFGRIVAGADGRPERLAGVCIDATDRKLADTQRDFLVQELSHRVKNTLATVISIQNQSFAKASSFDEARTSFGHRIRALAQTHGRLADGNWTGVSLETMLGDEVAPYLHENGENVRLSGPLVMLNAKSALTLGMAIHELVTNAAKHGALSRKGGSVAIHWQRDPPQNQLRIHWSESGGPAVARPKRSGFGRLLLERVLAADLGGRVELNFAARGLQCEIVIPLAENVATGS
jgi:PAS domain S-box-containing protein